jgi:hypothetical protein
MEPQGRGSSWWRLGKIKGILLGLSIAGATAPAQATPSTVFYTVATPYIQPFAVPHLTYDSYFSGSAAFPADVGLTAGLLPYKKIQAEVGFDLFYPGSDPFQLNFKAGVPEGAFGKYIPGITAGIFGMGFKSNVNNYDILHFEIGKTFPRIGTVSIGGYKGLKPKLLRSATGKNQDLGYMVSFYRTLEPWTERIAVTADYMSGKNVFGGGGAGLYFWFTKSIAVITGWVWFNDQKLNQPFRDGVFTIQLDIDFNFKNALPD